jgi:8-oxo-dGTP pyrophosphatase MutT (NUDIX family)
MLEQVHRRSSISPFTKHPNLDELIAQLQLSEPRNRQVVFVLLFDPTKTQICLMLSNKAIKDGRGNWVPPQGEIKRGEGHKQATIRELKEELMIDIKPEDVVYLGSCERVLAADHPKADVWDKMTYHTVFVCSQSYTLLPEREISEVRWYFARDVELWCESSMSPEKAEIFLESMAAAYKGPLLRKKEWKNFA